MVVPNINLDSLEQYILHIDYLNVVSKIRIIQAYNDCAHFVVIQVNSVTNPSVIWILELLTRRPLLSWGALIGVHSSVVSINSVGT